MTSAAVEATADGSGHESGEVEEVPVKLHCPQVIFDRYHVVAKANEAVDEVRCTESKTRLGLKQTGYVWLKNEANLTVKQREKLAWLTRPSTQLKTTRAARWRDDFNESYNKTSTEDAEMYIQNI